MRPIHRFAAAILLVSALSAGHAADPKTTTAAAIAPPGEEEQIDEGLKRFGYLAGLARSCVAVAQRPAFERETLDLHAGIARLLGIDRAFLFSSSFGYGATASLETKECTEVLRSYEARVEKHRKGQRGGR